MTATLDLNPEVEKGLLNQARDRGVSVDVYLQGIVIEQVRAAAERVGIENDRLKLPARHLGKMGSLRRCDIYDDVR